MKTQVRLRIATPAKINPFLWILGRRADGYHDVRLGYVAISLYDEIVLTPVSRAGVGLQVSGMAHSPGEDNLILRAARLYEEASGSTLSLEITLNKTIPVGAGLGGGSGNAAGVLMGLNGMMGNLLSGAELSGLAARLGSDVAFFLNCHPAIGHGRGEQLIPLPDFPRLNLVVVMPPLAISTAKAYALATPRGAAPEDPGLLDQEGVLAALENDFERPILENFPQTARARNCLLDAGAQGALLSGSGAAVFGVFSTDVAQQAAARQIREETGWQVFACHTLNGHSYLA